MIYFIIFLFLVIGLVLEYALVFNQVRLTIYYLVNWCLVCISAFRYRVGTDSISFNNLFDNGAHLSGDRYQPLWNVINIIADYIIGEFWAVQLIASTLFFLAINSHIRKHRDILITVSLIYFFPHYFTKNFELMRESFALSIFYLFGIKNLLNKNWKKYVLVCIVCFNFHAGAFYTIILPFLMRIRLEKYNLFVLCNNCVGIHFGRH